MEKTMEAAVEKVKRKSTFKQAIQSWIYQDDDATDNVTKWVVKTGTNHNPPVPLGECDGNWLARVWLMRKWYSAAEKEKKARLTPQRLRTKRQHQQKRESKKPHCKPYQQQHLETTPEHMHVDGYNSVSPSEDNETDNHTVDDNSR